MRASHASNPFHRIERWTGTYFREAFLWETGLHILVSHHAGDAICPSLKLQIKHLNHIQDLKDRDEQDRLRGAGALTESDPGPPRRNLDAWGTAPREDDDARALHSHDRGQDDLEEPIDLVPVPPEPTPNWSEVCAEEIAQAGNDNNTTYTNRSHGNSDIPAAPKWDAMMNPYVCVVHTNGVHYIALVYCICRGSDHAHADMLYSRLVPTSFDQYSTLFTTAVLDDFRLSNLECKTSAYQYFQKLHRETAPVSPAEVVNRSVTNTRCRGQLLHPLASYTELRRLSRQWRWLKQLKWAGYSHSGGHVREPHPGQLTLFCPACPQPGRNLPDSWKGDPNKSVPWHHVFIFFADMFFRKVFYRSFVADGNFKADHVRQKRSAGDVWLSEGGGMMPLREHYNEFLQTAAERPTVSCWFCQHQLN